MKLLVLGSGLIGPAVVHNTLLDPDVSQVMLCDKDEAKLTQAKAWLRQMPGGQKLTTIPFDLNAKAMTKTLMSEFDVAIAALPSTVSAQVIRLAVEAGTPLVDLTRPTSVEVSALDLVVKQHQGLVILGCGLEPGLTEIMAAHIIQKLDNVEELHIKCGGIPLNLTPPLNYKLVFGGRKLPLQEDPARLVKNGSLYSVPRYSEVETLEFPGVGLCEAWHEGFMPWLLDLPALKKLAHGTQKTIRWPGFAEKINLLKGMGLLSTEPVMVDGLQVKPKHLLDAVLYPHVKFEETDRDVVLFRVEAIGQKDGYQQRHQVEMIDYYDEAMGITAMARTTGYTGAIIARMIGRGDLKMQGMMAPERVIKGQMFEQLLTELAALNITFNITTERVEPLSKIRNKKLR